MEFFIKANIEEWLVKTGFKRWHEGKDTWYNGKYPTMRFVDLSTEPPWVGIKTGYSSMEYEHDCEDVPLIREKVLTIYNAKELAKNSGKTEKNDVKKSGVQVGEGVISTTPLVEPPSKPSPEAKKAPDESHEVLLEFTCKSKGCNRKLSKQAADASYFKYGKAMCYDCIKKEEDSQKPIMCIDCGLEVNSKQCEGQLRKKVPLDQFRCEDCEEKQKEKDEKNRAGIQNKGELLLDKLNHNKEPDHEIKKEIEGKDKEPEKKEGKTMNDNKLAVIPEGKLGKPLTDAERDNEIERAKAEKFLTKRGSSYSVQGKERPDSHMIQNVANEHNVSIEVLESVQDENHCFVKVRAHSGDQYVDAVVHHDYEIEYQLKTMEIIKKNPQILDHWEGFTPVLLSDAVVPIFDKNGRLKDQETATYYLVHALLSFRKFSMRDARTKAAAIASAMILNRDWRDPEEQDSEKAEASLVKETMNKKV